MPNQSLLGVVHLDHAAIGQERLVRQSLARRPDRCNTQSRLLRRPDPLVGGKLLERLRQLGVQEDPGQQPVGLHGDTIGIVPVRGVQPSGRERVPFGCGQYPPGTDGPVMYPLAIRTFVEALDRPGVDGPHPIQRRVRLLDPLPFQARRGQGALQQRRRHVLAHTAHLSSAERGGDPERGEVGRADARPGGARKNGTVSIGASDEPLGGVELRVGPGTTIDELHGRTPSSLLIVEEAGPGRDQPVVAGAVTMHAVLPIGSDGAGDDAGIERTERFVVDAERRRRPQREAVDDDIGCAGQLVELSPSLVAP